LRSTQQMNQVRARAMSRRRVADVASEVIDRHGKVGVAGT
jgi:hypothetical protein